ncbi:MAG: hypothetical protein V8Q42_08575 [Anaerovoracaceae bacterium]
MGFIKEKTRDLFPAGHQRGEYLYKRIHGRRAGGLRQSLPVRADVCRLGVELTNEDIAKNLSMEHEDVLKAWNHWEKMGAVRKVRRNPKTSSTMTWSSECSGSSFTARKSRSDRAYLTRTLQSFMADKDIQDMFREIEKIAGRIISGTEMMEILRG